MAWNEWMEIRWNWNVSIDCNKRWGCHCWLRHLIRVSLYQIQWRKIWLIDVIIWPVENTISRYVNNDNEDNNRWCYSIFARKASWGTDELQFLCNFFVCMMRVCVCKTFIIIFASHLLCSNWIGESE